MKCTIHLELSGFAVDVEETVDDAIEIVQIISMLVEAGGIPRGAEAGDMVAGNPKNVPLCPYHSTPLVDSKKKRGMLYCPTKNENGSYCQYEVSR